MITNRERELHAEVTPEHRGKPLSDWGGWSKGVRVRALNVLSALGIDTVGKLADAMRGDARPVLRWHRGIGEATYAELRACIAEHRADDRRAMTLDDALRNALADAADPIRAVRQLLTVSDPAELAPHVARLIVMARGYERMAEDPADPGSAYRIVRETERQLEKLGG